MSRFWSLLFLLVPVLGVSTFVAARFHLGPFDNLWLPESMGPRTQSIDYLFNTIHVILGIVLCITGLILALALWRFDARRVQVPGRFRSNVPLELVWTFIPGAILVFLSLGQVSVWNENKVDHPTLPGSTELQLPFARVVARQFSWRMVYPGLDGLLDTMDDVFRENELVVPLGETIVLELTSDDVIHSLFVPELRLKQDVIPGLRPHVWFQADRIGSTDLACTELCGWGHFKMQGVLHVVTREEYDAWIEQRLNEQFSVDHTDSL